MVLAALLLQGCTDQPVGTRSPDADTHGVIILPAVEGTACQYGGDYPFCRSAPSPDGSCRRPDH